MENLNKIIPTVEQTAKKRVGNPMGPLHLAREVMELSNKIAVLSDDYAFQYAFMQYVKQKDLALYNEAMMTAEAMCRLQGLNVPNSEE
jgi:hypothetical protein